MDRLLAAESRVNSQTLLLRMDQNLGSRVNLQTLLIGMDQNLGSKLYIQL